VAQRFVNGLLLGSNYALVAIGYTLVFGVTRLLTLAHGTVFMVSGVAAILVVSNLHAGLALGIVAALMVGGAAGVLTDALCFRPVDRTAPLAPAVATIGLALALQNAAVQLGGSENPFVLPRDVAPADIHLGTVLISTPQLAMFILAVALMVGIRWFVARTRWGAAMRAVGESPEAAELLGIDARMVGTCTLAVSGVLAGAAGVLVVLRTQAMSPFAGFQVGLTGLAVMTSAGLGNVTGAMVVGLAVGLADSILTPYTLGGFRSQIPWLLVIAVLLVRPQGLLTAVRR
jgi:branched-chain amino acid transport system permease protein